MTEYITKEAKLTEEISMVVDHHIVFDGHANKPNYLPKKAISSTNVSHPIHDQLLILVYVEFVAKVLLA